MERSIDQLAKKDSCISGSLFLLLLSSLKMVSNTQTTAMWIDMTGYLDMMKGGVVRNKGSPQASSST